jgi:hypothetical protein
MGLVIGESLFEKAARPAIRQMSYVVWEPRAPEFANLNKLERIQGIESSFWPYLDLADSARGYQSPVTFETQFK